MNKRGRINQEQQASKKRSSKEILTEAGGKQATNKVNQFACFVAVIKKKNVCFGNFEFRAPTTNSLRALNFE